MSDALSAPTYGEIVELRRQFRMIYATQALDFLLSTPAPSSAALTAWLDTPSNLDAYQRLIGTNAGATAVCSSSAAVAAIAGSTKALETLRDSSVGSAAMVNSKTALDAILAAGADAMATVLTIRAVRTAIYDSDTAFASLIASANGKAALNSIAIEHNNTTTTHAYPTGVNAAIRTVLISNRRFASAISWAGISADTYGATTIEFVDRYVRLKGLTHRISATGNTSVVRYVVME